MDARPGADDRGLIADAGRTIRSAVPNVGERLHDSIDIASGAIDTMAVSRPLRAAERVKRLADVGFQVSPSAFETPLYRLTPQAPFQAAPEAWIDAFEGTYSAGPGVDQIWWRLPSSFATEFMAGCNFTFREFPSGPSILTLVFDAFPFQGRTGVVVIDVGAFRTEIPISANVARTVDIGFDHDGADPLTTMVFFRPGIIDFVFHSTMLGRTIMPGSLSPWPEVKSGSNGHPIKTLQYLLRARGHNIAVDGVFGPQTETAVKAFQGNQGLAADGVVGPTVWPALVVEVQRGSRGDAVKGVQEEFEFRNLSGDPGKGLRVDGIFGPLTDAAVRGFQHALSLDIPAVQVDGIVGPVTWQALVSGMLSG
jgi:hypothetical protein